MPIVSSPPCEKGDELPGRSSPFSFVISSTSGEGETRGSPFIATRGLRLRGGWVDPLTLLDSLQYLAGYLVHFARSNSLLLFTSADSESSNHPTGSTPYGNDDFQGVERPGSLSSFLWAGKYGDLPF